ncbi:MAG: ABC transporter permease [Bacillota bacterium]
MAKTLWKWIGIPFIMIAIAAVVVIYSVNNPPDSIVERMLTYERVFRVIREHMGLLIVSMTGATIVGVGGGIMLSRPSLYQIGRVMETAVNIGQTVPSLAVLALFYTILGLGFNVAVFALFLYSILPVLRNTFAGIDGVEYSIIEAARGMGMRPLRILTRIELPIAFPIIVAGLRTAIVINVGAATLATFIGGGGLGDLIVTGLSVNRDLIILNGAVIAAVTAIILDYLIGKIEEKIVRWA